MVQYTSINMQFVTLTSWLSVCMSSTCTLFVEARELGGVAFRLFGQTVVVVSRLRTKPTKWHLRSSKTQISLGIHPVWSVFAVRMKKSWVLSYPLSAQRRLLSDWANAQADLSLRCAHSHFVGLSVTFTSRWCYGQALVWLWHFLCVFVKGLAYFCILILFSQISSRWAWPVSVWAGL